MFSVKSLSLLALFHDAPNSRLHVREVARRAGFSYERVCHYLKKLEEDGVLVAEVRGRNRELGLNFRSELAEKALALLDVQRRAKFRDGNKKLMQHVDRLAGLLSERVRDPLETILLLSRSAKGEVDVLLLTNQELSAFAYAEIERMCKDCSTEYNFRIYADTLSQFRTKWADLSYRKQWLDGTRLYGEDAFWREFFRLYRA